MEQATFLTSIASIACGSEQQYRYVSCTGTSKYVAILGASLGNPHLVVGPNSFQDTIYMTDPEGHTSLLTHEV